MGCVRDALGSWGIDVSLQVACTLCGYRYVLNERYAGTVVRCRTCGQEFRVPGPGEAEVADSALQVQDDEPEAGIKPPGNSASATAGGAKGRTPTPTATKPPAASAPAKPAASAAVPKPPQGPGAAKTSTAASAKPPTSPAASQKLPASAAPPKSPISPAVAKAPTAPAPVRPPSAAAPPAGSAPAKPPKGPQAARPPASRPAAAAGGKPAAAPNVGPRPGSAPAASSGAAVPDAAVPGGAVPGGAVPGGAVPGGAVPGGAVPGATVPAGAASSRPRAATVPEQPASPPARQASAATVFSQGLPSPSGQVSATARPPRPGVKPGQGPAVAQPPESLPSQPQMHGPGQLSAHRAAADAAAASPALAAPQAGTSEQLLHIGCGGCNREYTLPVSLLGTYLDCRGCGALIDTSGLAEQLASGMVPVASWSPQAGLAGAGIDPLLDDPLGGNTAAESVSLQRSTAPRRAARPRSRRPAGSLATTIVVWITALISACMIVLTVVLTIQALKNDGLRSLRRSRSRGIGAPAPPMHAPRHQVSLLMVAQQNGPVPRTVCGAGQHLAPAEAGAGVAPTVGRLPPLQRTQA